MNLKNKLTCLLMMLAIMLGMGQLSSRAAIAVAEDLLVDVDFTSLPDGTLTSTPNNGSLGGAIEASPVAGEQPTVGSAYGGSKGAIFDGNDYMAVFDSAGGPLTIAPAGIVGLDPTRSIEVWIINDNVPNEETMVAWGKRGGAAGQNMSFLYGNNASHGAVGHWGAPDMGWYDNTGSTAGAPDANTWHHLVYTYDGTTTRVYVDGALSNSEVLGAGVINTHTGTGIYIGSQLEADGITPTGGLRASSAFGKVRIHDGVLSDADVLNNYNEEVALFMDPPPPPEVLPLPLSSFPIHHYSFSEAAGAAEGKTLYDTVGGAHGTVPGAGAAFSGTQLELAGGPSTSAAYGDLPNGLVSAVGAANGGSGGLTIEGWATVTGAQNWGRLFDIGSSAFGEVNGPGGGGEGTDYIMLSATIGTDTANRRFEMRNIDPVDGGGGVTLDHATTTFNTEFHYAVTWDEPTGQLRVYENGEEVSAGTTTMQMSDLNDVNVWLGRSTWTGDANAQANFNDFRIYDAVLSPGELLGNFNAGPDAIQTTGAPVFISHPQGVTIFNGQSATFTADAAGAPGITLQWMKNGAPIAGATGPVLTLTSVPVTDDGASITLAATNGDGTTVSDPATLLVDTDSTPPSVTEATLNAARTRITLTYSEPVEFFSATDPFNYLLDPFVEIQGAEQTAPDTIRLELGVALSEGLEYTLTVSFIDDEANPPNTLFEQIVVLAVPGSSLGIGLTAYWNFEGDYLDRAGEVSGNANTVNDDGSTASSKFVPGGPIGKYGLFEFNDADIVNIPDSADIVGTGTDSITVSAWMTVAAYTANWQAIIASGEGDDWRLHRQGSENNALAFKGGGPGGEPAGGIAGGSVSDGAWHHVVGVTDNAAQMVHLYIDGALIASATGGNLVNQGPGVVMIGGNPQGGGRGWNGCIDEVAIWKRALSTDEVGELYALGLSGTALLPTQKKVVYDFNDGLVPEGTSVQGVSTVTATGGVDDSGVLHVTDAVNSQLGGFYVGDPHGGIIDSFEILADVRIGGGTARPADGMSWSIGSDVTAQPISEEGVGNGIRVTMDSWDNNGDDTAPSFDLFAGGTIVATVSMDGQREGGRAPATAFIDDPATGGPLTLNTGSDFAPLVIRLARDNTVTVTWKGVTVFDAVPVTWSPQAANFLIGGRTGGANDNHWVDNLCITTDFAPSEAILVTQPQDVTADENAIVSFEVEAAGTGPFTYQWGIVGLGDITPAQNPTATSRVLTGPATFDLNGLQFFVTVTGPLNVLVSDAATLTVIQDTTPPAILSARASGSLRQVIVTYSEPVEAFSGSDPFNYLLDPFVNVNAVSLSADGSVATLQLDDSLAEGTSYSVTASFIDDRASSPNTLEEGTATFSTPTATSGFVLREYHGVIPNTDASGQPIGGAVPGRYGGAGMGDLANAVADAAFEPPDYTCFTSEMEFNTVDQAESYVMQMRGLFQPDVTGDHTFYVSADDYAELWLSTDSDPANRVLIATEPVWNGRRQWVVTDRRNAAAPENISAPIALVAGERYYIQAIAKEGGGGDNLAVAVQQPGAPVPANGDAPIPGRMIYSLINPGASSLTITAQPQDVSTFENATATFTVAAEVVDPVCGGNPNYEWRRDGVSIPGATGSSYTTGPLGLGDDGSLFEVVVRTPGLGETSAAATLSVVRDVDPPELVGASGSETFDKITVVYNEFLEEFSSQDPFAYEVRDDSGATLLVIGVLPGADASSVVLCLDASTPQQPDTVYTVVVNGVLDAALNEIAPNSEVSFRSFVFSCGFVNARFYDGIGGVLVSDMTSNPNYPNNPSRTMLLSSIEPPQDSADNYGVEINGYIIADVTGPHNFFISADDGANFQLSTDSAPSNLEQVASEPIWNGGRQYLTLDRRNAAAPENRSTTLFPAGIEMVAGELRYFVGQMKEGGGGDNFSVAWQQPGGAEPAAGSAPIGGANIAIAADPTGAGVSFTQQPSDKMVPCLEDAVGGSVESFENGVPAGYSLYGTATVDANGGVGDSGKLSITTAANGQNGAVVIEDLNGGAPVQGMTIGFKLRIGDSTCCTDGPNIRPADGMSLNFANDIPDGTIGGAEEGIGSGLRVTFDTWDSGDTDEAPGIAVWWNGAQAGSVSTAEPKPSTGGVPVTPIPTDPATGEPMTLYTGADYANVKIVVEPDGTVDVWYKDVLVIDNLPTGYTPLTGARMMFAGRTGGANETHFVDDLSVEFIEACSGDYVENFGGGDGGYTVANTGSIGGPWTYNPAGNWFLNGEDNAGSPSHSRLTTPVMTATADGPVTLNLTHRYSIEGGLWDGGAIFISVNGSPFSQIPNAAFSANGYTGFGLIGNHDLNGGDGFNGDSPGYGAGDMIVSTATAAFSAGDEIQIQFLAAYDEFAKGTVPNWEIGQVEVIGACAGAVQSAPELLETFTVAASGFTATNPDSPLFYLWQCSTDGGASWTRVIGAEGPSLVVTLSLDTVNNLYRSVVYTPGATATSDAAGFIVMVNNPPTCDLGGDVTVDEDAGSQTVADQLTNVSPGPEAYEAGQTVTIDVSNDNPGLFSAQPAIDGSGALTFTAAADACGSATVTVVASDDGGTGCGGNDTGAAKSFVINVNCVNDCPTTSDQSVSLDEDTSISITLAGSDVDGDPIAFAIVSGPSNGSLSGTAPALIYTPNADYFGADSFSFAVTDGDPACTAGGTVSIVVNSVNDCPTAVATVVPPAMEGLSGTNYMVISPNNTNAIVLFDGSLSWDVEGDALSYLWTEVAPPEGSQVPVPPGKKNSKKFTKKSSKKSSKGVPVDPSAEVCDYGPVVQLSLQYEGGTTETILVVDRRGNILFAAAVDPGGIITVDGQEKDGKLGKEIAVLIGTDLNAGFHTSGSEAIGPGERSGSFLVTGGLSLSGNGLCQLAPPPLVDAVDFGDGVVAERELHLGQHNIVLTVSDGAVDCDDSDTVLVEVITAAQAVELCIELVDGSGADRKQKRSLVKALKKAAGEFDKGKIDKGSDKLEKFIKKVNKEADKGKISAADGAAFAACAQKVIDALHP